MAPPSAAIPPKPLVSPRQLIVAATGISSHLEAIAPSIVPLASASQTYLTHYGTSYNGQVLGCGYGDYSSDDPTIVAVGPSRSASWPCGTLLQICGPVKCMIAMRQDSCPGCSAYVLDLSEAGIGEVCGAATDVCQATVNPVVLCYPKASTEARAIIWGHPVAFRAATPMPESEQGSLSIPCDMAPNPN